jgi:hypothetical protein
MRCENCDSDFVKSVDHQRFCSRRCKKRAREKRRYKIRYERRQRIKNSGARFCAVCDKPFFLDLVDGLHKFCSIDCQRAWRTEYSRQYQTRYVAEHPKELVRIEKTCVHCNAPFSLMTKKGTKANNRKYCSVRCREIVVKEKKESPEYRRKHLDSQKKYRQNERGRYLRARRRYYYNKENHEKLLQAKKDQNKRNRALIELGRQMLQLTGVSLDD